MKIDITNLEYECTPEELAHEFCYLYEDGQAKFFNAVAEIFSHPKFSIAMQLEYLSSSKLLNDEGRRLMNLIGEYSQHNNT